MQLATTARAALRLGAEAPDSVHAEGSGTLAAIQPDLPDSGRLVVCLQRGDKHPRGVLRGRLLVPASSGWTPISAATQQPVRPELG